MEWYHVAYRNGMEWCHVAYGNGMEWCHVVYGNGMVWCHVEYRNGIVWCHVAYRLISCMTWARLKLFNPGIPSAKMPVIIEVWMDKEALDM